MNMIALKIDKQQALQQLELLGYNDSDQVYLRFFYGSNNPKKGGDRGRKLEGIVGNFERQFVPAITKYQREERGCYLVVNGQGHTDADVSFGRAIFYEHDNLDKDSQLHLWEKLGLPEPTFQVDSGGKSIHSYWVFNEFPFVDDWRKLQKDLLDYADADRSIKNPSRVMRLAGAYHIDYKDGELVINQSRIVSSSGIKYEFEELQKLIKSLSSSPATRSFGLQSLQNSDNQPQKSELITMDSVEGSFLPESDDQILENSAEENHCVPEILDGIEDFTSLTSPPLPERVLTSPDTSPSKVNGEARILTQSSKEVSEVKMDIQSKKSGTQGNFEKKTETKLPPPLWIFLTNEDRLLIKQGVGEGSRNKKGAKLVRNLIGTAKKLDQLNIVYSGNPYELFLDYCRKCTPSPDWNEGEWNQIWEYALKKDPSPTFDDEELTNRSKKFLGHSNGNGNGEVSYEDLVISSNGNGKGNSEEEDLKTKGISFGKTLKQLLNGKTVTRRNWSDRFAEYFVKYYQEGILVSAYDKDLRAGGKEIGKLKLTQKPFKQALSEMTQEDLREEGFPNLSVEDFHLRFFGDLNINDLVWVIHFEFYPNDNFSDDDYEYDDNLLFTEKAFQELYQGQNYICLVKSDKRFLYKYNGFYYEEVSKQEEEQRIAKWLVQHSFGKKKRITEPAKVTNILDWALVNLYVDHKRVNPPGLNLKNGILRVSWVNGRGKVNLVPHSPDEIYLYCSEVEYNPSADPSHCIKVLDCLDEPERKIFVRFISLAFDVPYLRTKIGRFRALMLQGRGSNGKDALRALVQSLFGYSMVSVGFSDFTDYDTGRKFPLSKLEGASISWASENSTFLSLDKQQALKAAITGESLAYELKGKDETPQGFIPKAILLFNCNEIPWVKQDMEAIQSRWGIIRFKKTYSMTPNKKLGECQAVPAYKDDPAFITQNIAPAFLNLLIKELEDIAINGIDFKPLEKNYQSLKRESNHLVQFCEDVGIEEDPEGKIYIKDLWGMLKQWYISNEILEIEKSDKGEILHWLDKSNKGKDPIIQHPRFIYQRFAQIFPRIEKQTETKDQNHKNNIFLRGISIFTSLTSPPLPERGLTSPDTSPSKVNGEARILTQQESEVSEVKSVNLSQIVKDTKLSELYKLFNLVMGEIDRREGMIAPIKEVMLKVANGEGTKDDLTALKEQYPMIMIQESWGLIAHHYPNEYKSLLTICGK
jgi:phage/plasmid-associated DNA primase